MKTTNVLAIALIALGGVITDTRAASLPEHSTLLLLPPVNRIVGTWEFQVHLFTCDTERTLARFRAASVYNSGGTMLDTNTAPPTTRGPAFGVWTFDPRTREYLTQFRLYRYNPDGSFAGVNEVSGTSRLSRDGNQMTGETTALILGPNEEVLAQSCGTNQGTRSL